MGNILYLFVGDSAVEGIIAHKDHEPSQRAEDTCISCTTMENEKRVNLFGCLKRVPLEMFVTP